MNKMNNEKLVFYSYNDAAKNMPFLFTNINEIWLSKKTNKLKNEFKEIFGFYDKNYLNNLVKYLN